MSATSDNDVGAFARMPRRGHDAAGLSATSIESDHIAGSAGQALALVDPGRARELRAASIAWPSVTLDPHQLADLELMLLGVFGPAPSYLGQLRQPDGPPVPSLPVAADVAAGLTVGSEVALRDREGVMIAALRLLAVEPVAQPAAPGPLEAPGPSEAAADGTGRALLVGTVQGLELPGHPDYPALRLTPPQLRAQLAARGWTASGTGAPWAVWADGLLHTADVGRIRALTRRGKHCVILVPVGGADPADATHHLRVRCLLAALDAIEAPLRPTEATLAHEPLASEAVARGGRRNLPPTGQAGPSGQGSSASRASQSPGPPQQRGMLVLVPVVPASQLAAPREPTMSATSPGGLTDELDAGGPALDAMAELTALRAHLAEVYGCAGSLTGPAIGAPGSDEITALLDAGAPLPAELTPPTVAAELVRAVPPRSRRGLTILFTGLSGAGKSTLAGLLACRLLERGRRVTLLDGDIVRTHLSQGLGFSRADRETNVRRIGFVAAEVAGAGGTAVCAPIAPYGAVREQVRAMSTARGAGFVLVHVSTPREVCEGRDRKGLYAKARAGVIPAFTGVSDPYEEPVDAEVVVNTADLSATEAVDQVVAHLVQAGWVEQAPRDEEPPQ
ncbi:sulfate adenylyltransferase [Parafrankia irregularis]|uniref:Adenylyl-sulfate kinase n=1 Tax=Parafrankia irregularis TaxID=795642 RepID=A0A0S4QL82_9ACTN|nr:MULTISPECIES: adenylyl-sulfate kinase [Parafrankia]MBE3202035.1 adenylyl-sulfate kinase [Parafrankia sp. CH37]CUU55810.1 sulfate adenylyltransferase [Parafrankia irregularis]